MDAAPGCRLQRCSSANVLTAWPGRVAHGRHQERVAPALLGPAHHVGALVENRTVQGPATARRRSELGNRRPLYGGQLSSPPYSGRRFANIQRQRGPAGPSISVFCADGPRRDRLTCTLHWRLSASRSIANLRTSCRGGWLLFGCPGRQIPTGGLQLAHRFGHWL